MRCKGFRISESQDNVKLEEYDRQVMDLDLGDTQEELKGKYSDLFKGVR